ncbi:MAG: gamma-glutamyltransferase, partial [Spirochaetales bacterium]|nr:gamma-glutamyltransferase [Spirochaetales bacterium]
MQFDPLSRAYPSARTVVYARNGMVCTGQPLAAQAGLEALRRGGNAVDAAIATATALTVVEPTANGIGGDAFALVWKDGQLYGLNSSGPAPALLSISSLAHQDPPSIDPLSWEAVTVPGIPAAWAALSSRFGALPYGDLFSDAIRYASDGFPVSPVCAHYWARACDRYSSVLKRAEFAEWFKVFTGGGSGSPGTNSPKAGSIWRSPDHAATLAELALSGSESFYRGEIASRIDAFSRETGGFLRLGDLERFAPEWVEPLSMRYHGYDVWELPPNGQGMVALAALGMLSGDALADLLPSEAAHLQIEALKLAFADASAYITERSRMPWSPEALLSVPYLASRRTSIGHTASIPTAGTPERGGTVYLATADSSGMMVSYIQ